MAAGLRLPSRNKGGLLLRGGEGKGEEGGGKGRERERGGRGRKGEGKGTWMEEERDGRGKGGEGKGREGGLCSSNISLKKTLQLGFRKYVYINNFNNKLGRGWLGYRSTSKFVCTRYYVHCTT